MLQVAFIRDHKETVLKGLAKRNFADAEKLIDEVIATDENRRATQTELDKTLSESNKLSKEIGILYKNGEAQKANILKEKTSQLKDSSNILNEKLNQLNIDLQELLYLIPNVPHESVPAGVTPRNDVNR